MRALNAGDVLLAELWPGYDGLTFESVEDLLTYAFRMEARIYSPRSGFEVESKSTNPAELSVMEKIADGAMVLRFIREFSGGSNQAPVLRQAGLRGRRVIEAKYRVAVGELRQRHEQDVEAVQKWLASEFRQWRGRVPRRGILSDFVREWSYWGRPKRTISEWGRVIGVPRKTISDWRAKAVEHLDQWLKVAQYRVEAEAKARGLME